MKIENIIEKFKMLLKRNNDAFVFISIGKSSLEEIIKSLQSAADEQKEMIELIKNCRNGFSKIYEDTEDIDIETFATNKIDTIDDFLEKYYLKSWDEICKDEK